MSECLYCEHCKWPRSANDNGGACKCKIMKYKTIDVYVSGGETPAWCPLLRGSEYIKRDDVLKALTDDGKDGPPYEVIPQVLAAARRKVKQIPAADVVPKNKYDLAVAEREANVKGFAEDLAKAKAEAASEIIDEIIDALQGEKDQEEKLGSNAWGESDTVGWHIHQYAEEKLDTLIIALSLYKREYTQEQNIGKTITVPKYKYTGN